MFSWVPITQSLEATPEPSGALPEEGRVHRQCHLGSQVERLGCLQPPLPRPDPDPKMEARGCPVPAHVLRMCLLCSQTHKLGPRRGPAPKPALDGSVLIPAQWLDSQSPPPENLSGRWGLICSDSYLPYTPCQSEGVTWEVAFLGWHHRVLGALGLCILAMCSAHYALSGLLDSWLSECGPWMAPDTDFIEGGWQKPHG